MTWRRPPPPSDALARPHGGSGLEAPGPSTGSGQSSTGLQIRDGLLVHFVDRAPIHMVPQPDTKDPKLKTAMTRKLQTVRDRAYLVAACVVSLTSFFGVPEGRR